MPQKRKPLYPIYSLAIADQHMSGRLSYITLRCEKHVITVLRYMFGSVYIFLLLMDLFHPKRLEKRDDFSHFWMVTFLAMPLMVYTFCSLSGLLESASMLRNSKREINVKLHAPKFFSRAIGIIIVYILSQKL